MTRWRVTAAILVGVMLCTGLAHGQSKDEIDRLRQDLNALRRDISQRFDRIENRLQIHGFVSQGYMKSNDNNYLTQSSEGSFEFNEVGINMRASLSDSLSVGAQLIGRDLGETGNNEVRIDWAYGDYNVAEWLGVRAGRVKIPVGMYNEERDIDAVRVPVLLPQAIYPENFRDLTIAVNGVSLYGNLQLNALGSLAYVAYIGGVDFDHDDNGLARVIESFAPVDVTNIDVDYSLGGALNWDTPVPGLRLHASYNRLSDIRAEQTLLFPPFSQSVSVNTRYSISAYGLEYAWNRLVLAAECQIHRGTNYTTTVGVPGEVRDSNYQRAYYGMATYQLLDNLAVGGMYGMHYLDWRDKDGDNLAALGLPRYLSYQRDAALFARVDLTPQWTVKAEYHFMKGASQLFASENTPNPLIPIPDIEETWQMLLLKVSYTF